MDKRMPWFKWWDGTCDDPKLRMVAREAGVSVATVVATWAYLLEKASTAVERGFVPADLDLELMADILGIEATDIETVRNGMKRRGLVSETGEITKWDERQSKREKSEPSGASTARVQRYREKQKALLGKDLGGETDGNGGNGNVTAETAGNVPKKKNKSRDSKPKTSSSSGDDGFAEFWEAYPRKQGKQDARKAWAKLKVGADLLAAILASIAEQKEGADWRRDDGEYIPHPATWLNGGRWLDEVRPYVPPPLKLPAGWWESREGMAAAGLMLTPPLKPNPGEYPKDFAQRIRVALGQIDASPGTALPTMAAPAPYIPPAPPENVILTDEQRAARRAELKGLAATIRKASTPQPMETQP